MTTHDEEHSESSFRIISETANGYIGKCACCGQYNFVYHNLLISFTEEELVNFLDWLQDNRFSRSAYSPLYNGRNRIYSSPHSNLFLVFNDEELNEIEWMTAEVKIMIEARDALRRMG